MNRNGIDVDLFQGWADQVMQEPETGVATVTIRHRWDDGFAVDTQCESLEEGGESYSRAQHTVRSDWPEPFGQDSGPTPGAELLAAALGAYVATTYIAKAELKELGQTVTHTSPVYASLANPVPLQLSVECMF